MGSNIRERDTPGFDVAKFRVHLAVGNLKQTQVLEVLVGFPGGGNQPHGSSLMQRSVEKLAAADMYFAVAAVGKTDDIGDRVGGVIGRISVSQ